MSDRAIMTDELREELEALTQAQEGFAEDFQSRALRVVAAFGRATLQKGRPLCLALREVESEETSTTTRKLR